MPVSQLTPREYTFYHALRGGRPVAIAKLYDLLYGEGEAAARTNRQQQQTLGPYVRIVNRKICDLGEEVVTGEPRRTYCLRRTSIADKKTSAAAGS